mmetsp:Transcript_38152/g.51624  ORF Transcript_38152/g.51624 Transcript_38152/m.51624 type:complete len:84 (+) Transcript_38152:54-305(+)
MSHYMDGIPTHCNSKRNAMMPLHHHGEPVDTSPQDNITDWLFSSVSLYADGQGGVMCAWIGNIMASSESEVSYEAGACVSASL